MKFALVVGDWSRNIGNAFFQLGAQWLLRQAFPEADLSLISDQPGYPSYWNRRGGNPENYMPMATAVHADYLVLVGPIFRPEVFDIWEASLAQVMSNGTELLLLGIGAMDYSPRQIERYRHFVEAFRPRALITRDHDTYTALGDLAEHAHDGVDLGFLLPKLYAARGLQRSPYLALNFDKIPEPSIQIGVEGGPGSEAVRGGSSPLDRTFEYEGSRWRVAFPRLRLWLARRSRYAMFLEGLLFPGNDVERLGSRQVMRSDHRPHPMVASKTYRYPNMMVNDTPYPYLELYAGADVTFSNRMHACVAALAYGRPAMLFSGSPRARLLERVGAEEIRSRPVRIPATRLEAEQEDMIEFLRRVL